MLPYLEIPSRQNVCTRCQTPFSAKDICHSLLMESQQIWTRQDLCQPCHDQFDSAKAAIRCTWKTIIPPKGTLSELPKQRDDRAMALLRLAIQNDTPEDRDEAFILALYLMRKRILCFRQEIDQLGERIQLYEVNATEEILPIKKVEKVPIETVRERIAAKLRGS